MTIPQAVAILRAASERCTREPVNTPEVRAALKALKPHVRLETLDWFWGDAGPGNEIGRSQNCRASLRGILRQLGLPDE